MSDKPNLNTLKEEIRALIADISELPLQDLKDDARFAEDLGIDSMMALEIMSAIEKQYRVIIPEENLVKIRSLKEVLEVAAKYLLDRGGING